METIDLASNTNSLFKTIARVTAPDNVCPHCLKDMKEIDRDDEVKVYPDSGPEVIKTNWVKYWCKNCGFENIVY